MINLAKTSRHSSTSKSHRQLFHLFFTAFACIILCFVVAGFLTHGAFADGDSGGNTVKTTFFGDVTDDGKGCGVFMILNTVIEVLSIGVGILGVVGIMITGIQYLTAKDNEEQVRKSKRRIFEIIIGLVAYAVLYAALQWLLPGGQLNTSGNCSTTPSAFIDTAQHISAITTTLPL